MNFKMTAAALAFSLIAAPAFASDDVVTSTAAKTTSVINASTLSAAAILSPGRYMTTIAPNFDGDMAVRLEKGVATIPGMKDVKSYSDDATIHFTVKVDSQIRVADIERVVALTDRSSVMSTPILESSMKLKPGF